MSDARESIGGLVAAEHGRLDSLIAELLGNLRETTEGASLQEAFGQLRDQFEAHLEREDRLYYPALRALRPGHRERLAAIATAHETFHSQLAQIEASLERGAIDAVARGLESLASQFAVHEVAEEQLLRQIDQEIGAKATTPAR